MNRLKKKNKAFFLFISLSIIVLLFSIFLVYSPVILLKTVKHFTNKNNNLFLDFTNLSYNPIKGSIKVSDIKFVNENIEVNIKFIDTVINWKKTLLLDPTLSYLNIERAEINIKNLGTKRESTPIDTFKVIPLKIEEILLTDSTIAISSQNKKKDIITQLNINIPNIDIKKREKIEPKITAFLLGNKLELSGKTEFNENSIKNVFHLFIKNFEISSISEYLSNIYGLRILSGSVEANINFNLIAYKNKKGIEFTLDGEINSKNTYIKEIINSNNLLENSNLKIKIQRYDIFNNSIYLKEMSLNEGSLTLVVSPEKKEASIFFAKNENIKFSNKKASFRVEKSDILNLTVKILDKYNKTDYIFTNSNIKIENFSPFSANETKFSFTTVLSNSAFLSTEGVFNIEKKYIFFNKSNIENLNIEELKKFIKPLEHIDRAVLKKFRGDIKISSEDIAIYGDFVISSILLNSKNKNNEIFASEVIIEGGSFNKKNIEYSFNSIKVNNVNFSINETEKINRLSFEIKGADFPITFKLEVDKKGSSFLNLKDKILIQNIFSEYQNKNGIIQILLKQLECSNVITVTLNPEFLIKGISTIKGVELSCINNDLRVLKISSFTAYIDNFISNPFFMSLKKVDIDSPFVSILLNKDKKIFALSIFELKSNNENKNKKTAIPLNIDYVSITEGSLIFKDDSLSLPVEYKAGKIKAYLENYPSSVFTQGKATITGEFQNRNSFYLTLNLKVQEETFGDFSTSDLLLIDLSPYFEYYIGHKVHTGTCNIKSKFSIKESSIEANNSLAFKNFTIKSTGIGPIKSINLENIIERAKDANGTLSIEVPIKGKLNSPEVDFRKLFFNTFLEIISNFGKGSIQMFTNFVADNFFEIIYFKDGTDEFSRQEEEIISHQMKSALSNNEKIFLIEGYVDKIKDSLELKKEKLKELIFKFSEKTPIENSEEEKEILKKIYIYLFNEEPKENESLAIKNKILESIELKDQDFYALSLKRIIKIKNLLITKYNIAENRIGYSEVSIFNNPYISGIKNSIAVLKSGRKR